MPHTLHESVRYERVVNSRFVQRDRSEQQEVKEIHSCSDHTLPGKTSSCFYSSLINWKWSCVCLIAMCVDSTMHGGPWGRLDSCTRPIVLSPAFVLWCWLRKAQTGKVVYSTVWFTRFTCKAYSQGSLRYEFAFSPFRSAPQQQHKRRLSAAGEHERVYESETFNSLAKYKKHNKESWIETDLKLLSHGLCSFEYSELKSFCCCLWFNISLFFAYKKRFNEISHKRISIKSELRYSS